jgi:hypothetical protein
VNNTDGDYCFKRQNGDKDEFFVYSLYCVNLNADILSGIQMFYLSEADELIQTVWSVYQYKDLTSKKCHLKFLGNGNVIKYEMNNNFDYSEDSKEVARYKWMM